MPQRLARFPGGDQNDVDQTKLVLDDVISPTLPYIAFIPNSAQNQVPIRLFIQGFAPRAYSRHKNDPREF